MIRGEATLSAIISLCLLAAQVMAITIDGEMSDWKGAAVYEMPQRAVENAGMPFGVVEQLQVTHDEQFLYFRIRFARARLFADEAQSRWPDRYRSSMRYIVLDTDGDAEPDYHTNQIARSDVGLDRTYVVRSTEEGLRETCLWFEDHPDWNDGPRGPLGIGQDVVGIRLHMSIRDGLEGENRWTTDDYPSADTWFLYDVASGEVIEPAEKQGPPQVRMRRADMPPRVDADLDDRRGHGRARRSGACCAAAAPADRPPGGRAEDDHTRAGDLDT